VTSATLPEAAAAYLAGLERELADIPPDERADLLEEVEASLIEAGEDPVARLGTPARFAAELRASAGLPPAPPPPRAEAPRAPLWQRLRRDPRTKAAVAAAKELAPIWWIVRAGLVLGLLTLGVQSWYGGVVPRLTGQPALDLLICAIPFAASIALGLAGRRRALPLRRLGIAVNLALVAGLALVPSIVGDFRDHLQQVVYEQVSVAPQGGLVDHGVRVDNIYPYDRRGRLLHDVRLFDGAGAPLNVGAGAEDPGRRPVATRGGHVVFNAFPIRYYEPHTHHVAHPNATPHGLDPQPLRR
jgi:hypothetical protein